MCGKPMHLSDVEWVVIRGMRADAKLRDMIIQNFRDSLVARAAEAVELFGDDELERFAEEQRGGKHRL